MKQKGEKERQRTSASCFSVKIINEYFKSRPRAARAAQGRALGVGYSAHFSRSKKGAGEGPARRPRKQAEPRRCLSWREGNQEQFTPQACGGRWPLNKARERR